MILKAIILTQAPIKDFEKEILKHTKIFKIALNQHAEELKPDVRMITDYILADICQNFPQKVISVRDKFRYETSRVEYFNTEFKGATIVAAIEYLISKNYDEILIVGDNTVNSTYFQNYTKKEVDILKKKAKVYQYSKRNFTLPFLSIKEFCKD